MYSLYFRRSQGDSIITNGMKIHNVIVSTKAKKQQLRKCKIFTRHQIFRLQIRKRAELSGIKRTQLYQRSDSLKTSDGTPHPIKLTKLKMGWSTIFMIASHQTFGLLTHQTLILCTITSMTSLIRTLISLVISFLMEANSEQWRLEDTNKEYLIKT